MIEKRAQKKSEVVWVGNTPITPFTAKEHREIDKRIKKRQEATQDLPRSSRQELDFGLANHRRSGKFRGRAGEASQRSDPISIERSTATTGREEKN